ncbi:M48 family metalloprotease [filamentous cyanobacterium LEGE 11480]|uniref:M48 family metalloprotease n=1 Tax=Romeriopsis navalis LEGE 11480 TaxID=2777977 RepID=A0A928Z3G5_9CYAN|nr:M48 family metalloprotease [Romeriopsis navalis]MBE9029178.1 M48 family metalloprotease [Romeriopsis navalis LEGE 11480]
MLYRFFRTRRWVYGLISLSIMLGITLGQMPVARAINWAEIIQRGIQLIQVSTISDNQEADIGKQLNDRIAKDMKLDRTSDLAKYVDRIGQNLVRYGERPKLKYTFQVVKDDNINAFASMGGYIYINEGVIKAADNEAQLASVVAHEAGHITGKHSVKRLQSAARAQLGLSVIGVKTNVLVNLAYDLLLNRPNSRKAEFNADERGLNMLSKAGYAQSEMPEFMKKLITDRRVPKILSTHPAPRDRVTTLEQQIQRNPSRGTAGTDAVAYAKRVNKPVSKVKPTVKPVVKPAVKPATTPKVIPSSSPRTAPVPTTSPKTPGGFVVPTE